MFVYYLRLGLLHLRRNPVLTALMVVTLAVGVAASISTLTILHSMSGDPIPHKSDRLFVPLLDVRPDDASDSRTDPPTQLTYRDVVALHDAGRGVRQSAMYMIAPLVQSDDPGRAPVFGPGLAVHAEFFEMLEIPFVQGGPWTAEDDARGAHVVVLRESFAERFFAGADPMGRTVRIGTIDHVVVGLVDDAWHPLPHFWRLVAGAGPFGGDDHLFIPFATAIAQEIEQQGETSCFSNRPGTSRGFEGLEQNECVWIQLWVELAAASDADEYRDFLASYVAEQRALGRFPRPDNHRLHDVREWLDVNHVVSKDSRLQTYLSFGFLLVCLVNVIALLLAKFTARSAEIGVRRALGASRRAIFHQTLVESAVVGTVGGVVGLVLTFGCLALIARQSEQLALLAEMDALMFVTTFALAIGASLLAGLLPTWRASRIDPARQLKSQ